MQVTDGLHAFLWESMSANNCNTYLIDGPARILIDPGHLHLFDHVERGLSDLGLGVGDIDLVLLTHCHPDHIEAVTRFAKSETLTALHQEEWGLIRRMDQYLATFGVRPEAIAPDFFLKEGDLNIRGLTLQVIHLPGHSPGSVAFFWPDRRALFTGDVVFDGGVGRTDLPGGSGPALRESIERVSEIRAEHVLPGHGPVISGAASVHENFKWLTANMLSYI